MFLCWVLAARYGETDEGQPYQQDASEVDFCRWRRVDEAPDGGYFENIAGQLGDAQDITHWMPLPAAPGAAPAAESPAPLTDEQIRAIFLSHGFTIKDGLTDLKPYVYEAARAIERAHGIGSKP